MISNNRVEFYNRISAANHTALFQSSILNIQQGQTISIATSITALILTTKTSATIVCKKYWKNYAS